MKGVAKVRRKRNRHTCSPHVCWMLAGLRWRCVRGTSKFEYEEPTAVGVGTAGGCTERLYDDTDHTHVIYVHIGM